MTYVGSMGLILVVLEGAVCWGGVRDKASLWGVSWTMVCF